MESNNIEIGKRIFEMDLGLFNNKTKCFKSVSENNWWRGEESYNTIKYKVLNSEFNKNIYKLYELSYLYEGLILSVEPYKVKNILNKYAEGFIYDLTVRINPLEKDKTPILDFFIYKEDYLNLEYGLSAFNELTTLINNLGYFISGKKDKGYYINFVIQPKFIYEITKYVYDSQNNDGILYHLTPLHNKKKILEKGLIPRRNKSRADEYPDRVYFYLKNQYSKLDKLCKDLSTDLFVKEWLILKIDLKDRRSYKENDKSTMYRFFDDPKTLNAVFTYENIDPLCIFIDKEIILD